MATVAYAKGTEVSVDKSRAEIERTVMRYGATGFVSGWQGSLAVISFEMKNRRVKFILNLPARDERRFLMDGYGRRRPPQKALEAWEQACREKWRALLLVVKAKLEAVESKIVAFEEEFMPYIVTASGLTLAEMILPQMDQVCLTGNLPPLLPGPKAAE